MASWEDGVRLSSGAWVSALAGLGWFQGIIVSLLAPTADTHQWLSQPSNTPLVGMRNAELEKYFSCILHATSNTAPLWQHTELVFTLVLAGAFLLWMLSWGRVNQKRYSIQIINKAQLCFVLKWREKKTYCISWLWDVVCSLSFEIFNPKLSF